MIVSDADILGYLEEMKNLRFVLVVKAPIGIRRSRIMTESKIHLKLKEIAKQNLLKLGYKEEEIFYEYPVTIHGRNYVIDVVGLSKEKGRHAIECGNVNCDIEKIKDLLCCFNEVTNLPYIIEKKTPKKKFNDRLCIRLTKRESEYLSLMFEKNNIKFRYFSQFVRYLLFSNLEEKIEYKEVIGNEM